MFHRFKSGRAGAKDNFRYFLKYKVKTSGPEDEPCLTPLLKD